MGFAVFALPLMAEQQALDAGAMYIEGWKLAKGEGCQVDIIRARELYRKAADLGDPRAMAWKARNLYDGVHGFSRDEAEARRIFQEIEPRLREMGSKKEEDALGSLCRTLARIDPKTRGQEAFELAQKNANGGTASDWNTLGWFFCDGIGVEKNGKRAFQWYQKAAEAGSSSGQKNLAYCYVNGFGVGKDCAIALSWYRKSAAQGNEEAMGGVGWCYEKGEGVGKDEKEALRWYLQAVDKGDDWSIGKLARMYEEGRGTEKNPAEAFRWWNRQVEEGDFWAPENVARCHANGIGTPKNPEEAAKWYGKVRVRLEEETKKNEAWAWDNLGRFYFNGLGVEKDYAKALECYRKAADLKSGWAMEQIGWSYEKGFGLPADDKEALQWYLKAAEAGQSWSMGQCARFYENGRGTDKNPTKAFEWYAKAADQGNRSALENLGRCYAQGAGVGKDESKALDYFQQAAEKGSVWAQTETGRYFIEGIGTKKDKKIALAWFQKSADQGNAYAQSWVGYAAENGWEQIPDMEDAMLWYRKSAEGGHAWSWTALGACFLREGTLHDPSEAVRCFQKANWAGDAWGTRLLAEAYAKGRGVARDPDLAASLYERVINTSEGLKAREALVDLHWGGKDQWRNANLQKGMDHWLILNSDPSVRVREIYATVKRLLEQGKPGSAAEVLDLFEEKQNPAAQPFPANLRVFRAGCRLMADRHVPEAWSSAIPTWFEPWAKRLRPYLKEKNGGNVTFSTGALEIHQKSSTQNYSPVMWLVEAWQNHVEWLFGLWAEEESGWYRSFVRSIKAVDRPVNLRWLEAGVSRKEEAWRDVEEVPLDQLSLPAVGGVMIVSRLHENPKRSKDLIQRLEQLETQQKERQKKELARKKPRKKNKKPEVSNEVCQQVRDLAVSGLASSRWWKEKGEVNLGFGFSSSDLGRGTSPLSWQSLPPFQTILEAWYRGLFKLFLQTRPDLVLRLGKLSEPILTDPNYNLTGYAYLLDLAYEAVAENDPSRREEAIQALNRWNLARGNAVTADRWQEKAQKESFPQKEKTERPVEKTSKSGDGASIPKEFQENAARATRLYAAGKMEEAIREYQTILKKYPNSIYALSNIGVVRFQQKDYAESEKVLREALRQSPNDAFSNSVLGVVLLQLGKLEEAEDVLKRASALDSTNAKTLNYLGIVHFKKGRREESIRCTIQALEVDPKYGDAHFNLAVLYAGGTSEEKKLARTHYQLAMDLQVPRDPNLEQILK